MVEGTARRLRYNRSVTEQSQPRTASSAYELAAAGIRSLSRPGGCG